MRIFDSAFWQNISQLMLKIDMQIKCNVMNNEYLYDIPHSTHTLVDCGIRKIPPLFLNGHMSYIYNIFIVLFIVKVLTSTYPFVKTYLANPIEMCWFCVSFPTITH